MGNYVYMLQPLSCVFCPKLGVIFSSFVVSVFVLYSVRACTAVFLKHFISAAVILLASLSCQILL